MWDFSDRRVVGKLNANTKHYSSVLLCFYCFSEHNLYNIYTYTLPETVRGESVWYMLTVCWGRLLGNPSFISTSVVVVVAVVDVIVC